MQSVVIYTKPGVCAFCTMAKNLLRNKNIVFEERVIGTDISLEKFKADYPGVGSAPFIVTENYTVGGYEQLVEWVNNEQQFLIEG